MLNALLLDVINDPTYRRPRHGAVTRLGNVSIGKVRKRRSTVTHMLGRRQAFNTLLLSRVEVRGPSPVKASEVASATLVDGCLLCATFMGKPGNERRDVGRGKALHDF